MQHHGERYDAQNDARSVTVACIDRLLYGAMAIYKSRRICNGLEPWVLTSLTDLEMPIGYVRIITS